MHLCQLLGNESGVAYSTSREDNSYSLSLEITSFNLHRLNYFIYLYKTCTCHCINVERLVLLFHCFWKAKRVPSVKGIYHGFGFSAWSTYFCNCEPLPWLWVSNDLVLFNFFTFLCRVESVILIHKISACNRVICSIKGRMQLLWWHKNVLFSTKHLSWLFWFFFFLHMTA